MDSARKQKDKLETRVRTCILLGYAMDQKGFKLLDVITGQIVTARRENIRFHESVTIASDYIEKLLLNTFFQADYDIPEHAPVVRIKSNIKTYLDEEKRAPAPAESVGARGGSTLQVVDADKPAPATAKNADQPVMAKTAAAPSGVSKRKRLDVEQAEMVRSMRDDDDWAPTQSTKDKPVSTRQLTKRVRKPPVHLQDYIVASMQIKQEQIAIPNNPREARASPQAKFWDQAMLDEMESLFDHRTWELVRRSETHGRKPITCRWVYTVKRDEMGRIKRYKARLVIHGFKQRPGLEYSETYAPVIRFETIRSAIYFALKRGWKIMQYDVKTAFLYGDLDEEIFMEQPPGHAQDPDVFVCRLRKSLYGLRQAPNVWYRTLHAKLKRMEFKRLDSDYGLYAQTVGETGEIAILLSVYVDDLLLMGPPELCRCVAQQLMDEFQLTELGPVKYLLGVEILISPERDQVVFSQRQHIKTVLQRFDMASCNGCATPEATSPQQMKPPPPGTYLPYRELVGALQYLVSASRPDIAHAARTLGKFMANYTFEHYFMAKRVLRYLAATVDFGLVMDVVEGPGVVVSCFTDADYANDPADCKSVSGYVTMLDGNAISYASRKQAINAQSTAEAEYIAMSEGVKDILWAVSLCEELRWTVEGPVLYGDNMGSIYMSVKPGKHSKSKHINNKYHLTRHLVEDKRLETKHVGTNDMVADIFTKALGRVKFEHFREKLKVLPLPPSSDAEQVGAVARRVRGSSSSKN
jgi:hypothetical protein